MNFRLRRQIRRLRKRREQLHKQIAAELDNAVDMHDQMAEAALQFNDEMVLFYRYEELSHRKSARELARQASEIRVEIMELCRRL